VIDVNAEIIEAHITQDPEILGGKPIIRGTRVPVYIIVDLVSNGSSIEQVVDDYPDLTLDDVNAALEFVKTVHHYSELTTGTVKAAPQIAGQHATRTEARPW
jgi:uncharacterized protein (DUF433 family)